MRFARAQPFQPSPCQQWLGYAVVSSFEAHLISFTFVTDCHFLRQLLPTPPRGDAVADCCQLNDLISWMRLSLMVVLDFMDVRWHAGRRGWLHRLVRPFFQIKYYLEKQSPTANIKVRCCL